VKILATRGDEAHLGTRSGTLVPGAAALRLDAADGESFAAAARGASTIFLCTNPPYHRWAAEWLPIFASAVHAAQRSRASLVIMGNLYPYGRASMPMTEHSPEITSEAKGLIRQQGWELVRAAHKRGDVRAVEVRASDYFGPGAEATAHLGKRFFEPLLAGRTAWVIGDPEAPHSWAYLPDIARTLVAAADYEGDWGRVWHVPSASSKSRVEIAREIGRGRVSGIPQWLLRVTGAFSPTLREVYASSYQFTGPFIADASESEQLLDVSATPWEEALDATVASYAPARAVLRTRSTTSS
jgi:nucleoside-diphosphate-sugar epimerase